MRLVTYTSGNSFPRLGVLDGDLVVDPQATLAAAAALTGDSPDPGRSVPTDVLAYLSAGSESRRFTEGALTAVAAATQRGDDLNQPGRLAATTPMADVHLLAPVPRPRRVRDYLTYNQHAQGSGIDVIPAAFAAMPICYKCNVESIIGPEEPLLWPSYTEQLDFELEIGFYTSGGGRNMTVEEAQRCIAGVTLFNDVSARDIQMFEMGLTIGPSKGKDFCTAMGPTLVTIDEVDEWSIEVSARVNGEQWAAGTTKDRQFSFAEVLAWASLDETVYPGEFFGLGTVGGGCGLELDRWIQPGDVVELEASGIGVLRNPVGQKELRRPGSGLRSYQGSPAVHVTHPA